MISSCYIPKNEVCKCYIYLTEKGRYTKSRTPRHERLCQSCNCIENELRFETTCSLDLTKRKALCKFAEHIMDLTTYMVRSPYEPLWYFPRIDSLRWRHNGRDDVSNHRRLGCSPNRLLRRRSKKIPNLSVTGLVRGIHRWIPRT